MHSSISLIHKEERIINKKMTKGHMALYQLNFLCYLQYESKIDTFKIRYFICQHFVYLTSSTLEQQLANPPY